MTGFFFGFFYQGKGGSKYLLNGPSLARQQNAIKWHFAGMPLMAQH